MMNGLRCMRRCVSVVTSGRSREISCQAKWKPVCLFGTSALTHANDTVGEIARQWRERFEKEGIPEPIESIEHIIAHIIGTSKITDLVIHNDMKLDNEQIQRLNSLCECRLLRMPVQYIIGEWDFRDLTLKLVPPVFIPRPETEILVEIMLKVISSVDSVDKLNVLEIGCGSGAISLSLLKSCKKVNCIAIDTNIHACNLTLENAEKLGLKERLKVFNATLKEDETISLDSTFNGDSEIDLNSANQFDFIISNPPYIPTKQIFKLEPEVKVYEDIRALDGGKDGLKVIKPMLKYASVALKPGGRIFFEVDPSHPDYVEFFTKKYTELKLQYGHTYKDYCNKERFIEVLKVV